MATTEDDDAPETVEMWGTGQITIPKDIRDDLETGMFKIEASDSGKITLTPVSLSEMTEQGS